MVEQIQRRRSRQNGEAASAVSVAEKKHWRLSHTITAIGLALVLGLGALVTIQFVQLQALRNPNANEQQRTADAAELVAQASKLMLLPDEEATVATVEDAEALSSQPFFARAANGDRVLIFPESELAVIYRPSAHLIVNAGPLVLNAAELAANQGGSAAGDPVEGETAEGDPVEQAPEVVPEEAPAE